MFSARSYIDAFGFFFITKSENGIGKSALNLASFNTKQIAQFYKTD